MQIVRIYKTEGNLRFEGVKGFTELGDAVFFRYTAKDDNGNPTDANASACFSLRVIHGYSVEEAR